MVPRNAEIYKFTENISVPGKLAELGRLYSKGVKATTLWGFFKCFRHCMKI